MARYSLKILGIHWPYSNCNPPFVRQNKRSCTLWHACQYHSNQKFPWNKSFKSISHYCILVWFNQWLREPDLKQPRKLVESLDLSQWACSHNSAKNLADLSLPLFIYRSRVWIRINKVNIYFRLWIFVGNQWVVRTHNTRSYFLNETYSLVNSPLHQQRATLLAFFPYQHQPPLFFLLSESKR